MIKAAKFGIMAANSFNGKSRKDQCHADKSQRTRGDAAKDGKRRQIPGRPYPGGHSGLTMDTDHLEFVFDDSVPVGTYFIAIYTRNGKARATHQPVPAAR